MIVIKLGEAEGEGERGGGGRIGRSKRGGGRRERVRGGWSRRAGFSIENYHSDFISHK